MDNGQRTMANRQQTTDSGHLRAVMRSLARASAYVSSEQNYDDDFYWVSSHCLSRGLRLPAPACACLAAVLSESIKNQ